MRMEYLKEKKHVVFWGAGEMCRKFIELNDSNIKPYCIIDSNKGKKGEKIKGIKIIAPEEIENWNNFFVIVTTQFEKEIYTELEKKGLQYRYDFFSLSELWKQNINMKNLQDSLSEYYFTEKGLSLEFEEKISSHIKI